jgi:hypothetical protein
MSLLPLKIYLKSKYDCGNSGNPSTPLNEPLTFLSKRMCVTENQLVSAHG